MSRALIILNGKAQRDRASAWIANAPVGTRVEFKAPRRTLPQNDIMWAHLTDIARQRPVHHGVKMTADKWKMVFLNALGGQLEVMPNLDGDGFFPIGQRSSDLSKEEMSALIDLIHAWAAAEGIDLNGERAAA